MFWFVVMTASLWQSFVLYCSEHQLVSLRSGTSQRNVSPTKSANSNNGKVSVSEWYGDRIRTPPEIVCSTPDVKFDKQLPPSQADALSSIKQMICMSCKENRKCCQGNRHKQTSSPIVDLVIGRRKSAM
jgi:hypothetical protein